MTDDLVKRLRDRIEALEKSLSDAVDVQLKLARDRDESCLALGNEIEALRKDVITADTRAQSAEAERDTLEARMVEALARERALYDAWLAYHGRFPCDRTDEQQRAISDAMLDSAAAFQAAAATLTKEPANG